MNTEPAINPTTGRLITETNALLTAAAERDLLMLPRQRHGADPCSLTPPVDGWTTDLPGVVGWYWAGLADCGSADPAVPVEVRQDGPELRSYIDGEPVDWDWIEVWGPRIAGPPGGLAEALRVVRVASWGGGNDGC